MAFDGQPEDAVTLNFDVASLEHPKQVDLAEQASDAAERPAIVQAVQPEPTVKPETPTTVVLPPKVSPTEPHDTPLLTATLPTLNPIFSQMYSRLPRYRQRQYEAFLRSRPSHPDEGNLAARIKTFIETNRPTIEIDSVMCNTQICEIRWQGPVYGISVLLQKSEDFPEFYVFDPARGDTHAMNYTNSKEADAFIVWVVIDTAEVGG